MTIILLLAAVACAGREKCVLPAAPGLFDLRLGMTAAETRAASGGAIRAKDKERGFYVFFRNYLDRRPPPALPGARAVYLRFFEGRLYQIEVFFERRSRAETLDNFIERYSAGWNIPPSAWQREFGEAEIRCDDFSVLADYVLNPRLQLTDEMMRAKVEEMREAN